tara:strand:+ start:171 stop:434 length:264 start_codon:yes stop_codon:yes gene_type:complete
MPRYLYACTECDLTGSFFHSINEKLEDCDSCSTSGSMQKMLSVPFIQKEPSVESSQVGTLTREYIELNREILKEQQSKPMEIDNESS